jgi:hypothetical protein
MDTLRGNFGSDSAGENPDFDDIEDLATDLAGPDHDAAASRDLPPDAIGQDERRMQVRAYNHWASLLGERTFPSIEDLEPADLPDFGPYSVLLDFSTGIEDPVVQFLGEELAKECGASDQIESLSDVPPRSLLSRITDHYLQIMANQAPIGFEAEFVNQRGASILYRGILLPYSSDDESIDFIYGVINWKEMADAATADELLLEIDQALEADEAAARRHDDALADWADSPAHEGGERGALITPADDMMDDNVLDLGKGAHEIGGAGDDEMPMPEFGSDYEADFSQYALDDPDEDPEEDDSAAYSFASLADYIEAPAKKAVDLDADRFDPADYRIEEPGEEDMTGDETPAAPIPQAYMPETHTPQTLTPQTQTHEAEPAPIQPAETPAAQQVPEQPTVNEPTVDEPGEDASLHDYLAAAREMALTARATEDRSRQALYAAVGRAYDFSIAARQAPEDYEALVEESGLTVQGRAPMTPIVKLVFGSDYDKTRLTEYAAVLNHAHRLELERGTLADFLSSAEGGLKGVVDAERRLRREESGKPVEPEEAIRAALAQKLRELEALTMDAIAADGPEFSLLMLRRDGSGGIDIVGEIGDDNALVERAARKLVG